MRSLGRIAFAAPFIALVAFAYLVALLIEYTNGGRPANYLEKTR
jgi:hypothetical protein